MQDKNHNGWTNYETWRINLEIFSDCYEDFYDYNTDDLKEYTEDVYKGDNDLGNGLIYAFISMVNFHEILDHIKENWEENHCDNCNEQLDFDTSVGAFCSEECKKEEEVLSTFEKG